MDWEAFWIEVNLKLNSIQQWMSNFPSNVSNYFKGQWSKFCLYLNLLKNTPTTKDEKHIISICIIINIISTILAWTLIDIPTVKVLALNLSLTLVSAIMGFCGASRARLWGFLFFCMNIGLWIYAAISTHNELSGNSIVG